MLNESANSNLYKQLLPDKNCAQADQRETKKSVREIRV